MYCLIVFFIVQDPSNQLLLLVSHDTNILYLQRLLDLSWIPNGFTNNIATTGGSLSFELWKSTDGDVEELFVKVKFLHSPPPYDMTLTGSNSNSN